MTYAQYWANTGLGILAGICAIGVFAYLHDLFTSRRKKMFQPIDLGDRVKDPITGLTGIVICTTVWLHGCIRMGVQPEKLKDGKQQEAQHFDQSQLVVVKKRVHEPLVFAAVPAPPAETRRSNGGPTREGPGFYR